MGRGLFLFVFTACLASMGIQGCHDEEIEHRTVDGTGNNLDQPEYGSAGQQLVRLVDSDYGDGTSAPAGSTRKSAREISNLLSAQTSDIPNSRGASDFIWQWGQFLDHDIDLTPGAEPKEPLPIAVPTGDPHFDPFAEGNKTIGFARSIYDPATGTGAGNPRQQLNLITSFIDASNVYGSDAERADALRANDGTGKLKTSGGGLFLPFNEGGVPNAGGPSPTLFLAGDVRANEQVCLTVMHTLFMREHNRLCEQVQAADPDLPGEETYQIARKIVGAQMQVITYREFLPILLGPDALPPYTGYNPDLNAGIQNSFSTAAFRYGHSQLSELLQRIGAGGISLEPVPLKDAFFNPSLVDKDGQGIEQWLLGLSSQLAQQVDIKVVDAVRNFLFGPPGSGGFDLASLNAQRGRDHGLADYNSTRIAYGLPVRGYSEITFDPALQSALQTAYSDIADMDLWVVGLAEDHVPGAMVGEIVRTLLVEQFTALRDGDRFWYENDPFFRGRRLKKIRKTTLADIIRRNTGIDDELPDNPFLVPSDAPDEDDDEEDEDDDDEDDD